MEKTIKKLEQSIYNGKVSYSVDFDDGSGGLLTNSTLTQDFGGNLPASWVEGGKVDADVEQVTSKNGKQWYSVKPAKAQAPQGAPQPTSTGKSSWKGDDVYSKMVNTAMMVAGDVAVGKDQASIIATFDALVDAMVKKYKLISA